MNDNLSINEGTGGKLMEETTEIYEEPAEINEEIAPTQSSIYNRHFS